jgi:hypothetical protein
MSRAWNYDGDEYPLALWEQSLRNALNSKRGQTFLRELESELLAMQARGEGRLVSGYLIADGANPDENYLPTPPIGCCTLGVMAKKRLDAELLANWLNTPLEEAWDLEGLHKSLNIARCLITEIGVANDSGEYSNSTEESEEQRFTRMLAWVRRHIQKNGQLVER